MSDVFISYARSTAKQAQAIAAALRGLAADQPIGPDDRLGAGAGEIHAVDAARRAGHELLGEDPAEGDLIVIDATVTGKEAAPLSTGFPGTGGGGGPGGGGGGGGRRPF